MYTRQTDKNFSIPKVVEQNIFGSRQDDITHYLKRNRGITLLLTSIFPNTKLDFSKISIGCGTINNSKITIVPLDDQNICKFIANGRFVDIPLNASVTKTEFSQRIAQMLNPYCYSLN